MGHPHPLRDLRLKLSAESDTAAIKKIRARHCRTSVLFSLAYCPWHPAIWPAVRGGYMSQTKPKSHSHNDRGAVTTFDEARAQLVPGVPQGIEFKLMWADRKARVVFGSLGEPGQQPTMDFDLTRYDIETPEEAFESLLTAALEKGLAQPGDTIAFVRIPDVVN